MPKQTELSFEEIMEKLNTGNTSMPGAACGGKGFLVNELGELGLKGDKRVERELISLLGTKFRYNPDLHARHAAWGWLGRIGSEKNLECFEKLAEKEKNEVVKEMAEESIAQIRVAIAAKN